jgi:hypothetical protein
MNISQMAMIAPATQSGYYFASTFATDSFDGLSVIGNKRGLRPEGIARLLTDAGKEVVVDFLDATIEVITVTEEPWAFHKFLYSTHQGYIDREILGLRS